MTWTAIVFRKKKQSIQLLELQDFAVLHVPFETYFYFTHYVQIRLSFK